MRSYKNKKGETVKVSEGHLELSIALKKKLQRDSPSNRCSWAKHKKLMEQEGYKDSENSESYRQMIKQYQKTVGELPTVGEYADMVADTKIESYKKLVGEVAWETQENRSYLRQIRKGKKDIITQGLLIQEVSKAVKEILRELDIKRINKLPSPSIDHDGTRMILCLTDWHIGALVNVEKNRYNLEVAKKRINQAIEKTILRARKENVEKIDVVYMGDMLEHAYMREAQAYEAEFPVAQQMVYGGKLLVELLNKLSKEFYVTYRGFAGNHDRLNRDKNANIHGDTGMVVVNEIVKQFIDLMESDRLSYFECEDYSASLIDVNGRNFKFVHGDLEKKADTRKIDIHSSKDNITYHVIAYGHFHHYMVLEVGIERYEIRVGSIKGYDNYADKFHLASSPSQAVILVSKDGEIKSEKIGLD